MSSTAPCLHDVESRLRGLETCAGRGDVFRTRDLHAVELGLGAGQRRLRLLHVLRAAAGR